MDGRTYVHMKGHMYAWTNRDIEAGFIRSTWRSRPKNESHVEFIDPRRAPTLGDAGTLAIFSEECSGDNISEWPIFHTF